MEQILKEEIICNNAMQTEAAVKKHEAISAEILARVRNCHTFIIFRVLVTEFSQTNNKVEFQDPLNNFFFTE